MDKRVYIKYRKEKNIHGRMSVPSWLKYLAICVPYSKCFFLSHIPCVKYNGVKIAGYRWVLMMEGIAENGHQMPPYKFQKNCEKQVE